MEIKGSKIIMECLREQGVDTIFGYPGGQIMPLYDALYDYRDEIKHVLTSHEQGATHAADGYARSTGKVGVAFATSGPGATNTVTGIATALWIHPYGRYHGSGPAESHRKGFFPGGRYRRYNYPYH